MLRHLSNNLQNKTIILASSSPRRQEILQKMGLDLITCVPKFEENLKFEDYNAFDKFLEATAYGKVNEVYNRLVDDGKTPDLVIGADTMVVLDGKMFGKPKDSADAFNTLKILSGKYHKVYTGVVLKTRDKLVSFTESTNVFIGSLSDDEIKAYVATGEPMDKAGSYGVQGIGGCIVERIEGDYYTAVGLPLYKVYKEITKLTL